jgi:hypothetical protein
MVVVVARSSRQDTVSAVEQRMWLRAHAPCTENCNGMISQILQDLVRNTGNTALHVTSSLMKGAAYKGCKGYNRREGEGGPRG